MVVLEEGSSDGGEYGAEKKDAHQTEVTYDYIYINNKVISFKTIIIMIVETSLMITRLKG